jgi:hypothetical protein
VDVTRRGTDLIVLHDAPDAVAALLPPELRRRVQFVEGDPVDIGSRPWPSVELGPIERIVTFPIDGPRAAVELAMAGLLEGDLATVAAPSTPGGVPTAWWVLDLLARYTTPAVDLRHVTWLDDSGLWWTHPTGPVRLPLVVDGPASSAKAARVLQVAAAVLPGEPASLWLDSVAGGGHAAPAAWCGLLCARYLAIAIGRSARHRHASPDLGQAM